MFTRFKLLSVVLFFALSLILITLVWGENGYFVRKNMENNLEVLIQEAKEREMELALLRERNEAESVDENKNLELVLAFDNDGLMQGDDSFDGLLNEYDGLKWWECVLWALFSTAVYSVFIAFAPLLCSKKNRNGKEKKHDCNN